MTEPVSIDVYPVGLLADLKHRRPLRRIVEELRRSGRGGYLNGYLAEVNYPPEGLRHRRCGHGWTQGRALARLGLYLAQDNPGQGVAGRDAWRSGHLVGRVRWWAYTVRGRRWSLHVARHPFALDVHLGSRGLAVTLA